MAKDAVFFVVSYFVEDGGFGRRAFSTPGPARVEGSAGSAEQNFLG